MSAGEARVPGVMIDAEHHAAPRSTTLRRLGQLLLVLLVLVLGASACARDDASPAGRSAPAMLGEVAVDALPPEGRSTLALIRRGGPFPYRKDGAVFGNRERLLPRRPRGYYTEYTVPTPGSRDRGARRIVAGKGPSGDPSSSGEYYYTDDHYQSFRRIRQ
jgi:ribonuclease T1